MREILFRGQTRRKGEKVRLDGAPVDSNWVHGGVSQNGRIIYQMEPEINKFPVYPDTVGQYTGLTDRNGNKIFEGDIVKILYCDEIAVVRYSCDEAMFELVGRNYCWTLASYVDVIGNIYDDPELIGGDGDA